MLVENSPDIPHILLVDDDPSIIDLLSAILNDSKESYSVSTALDAVSMRKEIQKFIPDVLFLDLILPDGNGADICAEIKALNKNIKVCLISGKTDGKVKHKGYLSGADDFISKPFDIDEVDAKTRLLSKLKRTQEILKENLSLVRDVLSTLRELYEQSEIKNDYLKAKVTRLLGEKTEQKKVLKSVDYIKLTLPNIANSDIPLLKSIGHIMRKSRPFLQKVVSLGDNDEDYTRALLDTIEPLDTVVSNISALVLFLIDMGLINAEEIYGQDIRNSSFYSIMEDMVSMGRISGDALDEIIKNAQMQRPNEQDVELF